MPFIGRVRELLLVENSIGARVGSACLLVGEPGIGKSALAHEVARVYDAAVVVASPNERMWPYSGISALSAALGGGRGAALDSVLARGRDWPEHLLAEELSRTLHLVRDEPAVLVIDDLDEMDSASITVLSFVFGRLRGTGLSVVATVGCLDGRHDFAGMTHTHIDRLSFVDSVEVARAHLGPGTAQVVLFMVAKYAGGDPRLISRVRLTPAEAAGDAALPIPLRLIDEESGRRRRPPRSFRDPATNAVLDLLSVGPVYGYDRLRITAAELGVEIDALIDAGLVAVQGDLARIADPALRLRHHSALPAEERRRLHTRAAADHEGAYHATHRWHLSFVDPLGDRSDLLWAAADLARAGETAAAVEFAERALGGEVDDDVRVRHLVVLGEALVLHNRSVLGRHYLRRAGHVLDPDLRARCALALLRATAIVDHVVDDALVAATVDGVSPRAAESLLCECARLHMERTEIAEALACIRAVVDRDLVGAETRRLARVFEEWGMDAVLPVMIDVGGAEPVAPADLPVEQALLALGVQVLREEYASVRHQVTALLERSPRPLPMWRQQVQTVLVVNEIRGGDPVAAREAVIAWRREWALGRTADAATMLLMAAAAALDPLDADAAELVHRGRDLARREGTPALLPWFAVIEGGLALAEGRADDAVSALRAARELAPGDDPSLLRADADLIEALWLSGHRDQARAELARLEAAAERTPRRWTTLAVARSRAVCRCEQDGVTAFREAEAVLRTDDAPAERRRLSASRERCLPGVGRTPAPRALVATSTSRTLSPQEKEVVELVGRGLRNREIAAALYISLRTVELRLTGIYRKLGVSSRAHLIALQHGSTAAS
ncbi:AAA family ATPase [Microbacterium sp. NPDC090007]|uniref:helix-turn-helix transcriptional regulator n=1 Tax=Microbacterium sp. NPDC090007 TaxID=3364204 RepID=UPI003802B08E